jgi:hypothetical protein
MRGRFMFGAAALLALAAILVSAALTSGANASPPDAIKAAKAAAARYHSVEQAEAAGYVLASPCVASPEGAMGFHYENPALMADDAIDPASPEILVYAAKANGRLALVAVEYWKEDADGSLATAGDRPSVVGQPFDGPMPGHSPVMPVHYDLHVWLYESNESGLFAPFNPGVSC